MTARYEEYRQREYEFWRQGAEDYEHYWSALTRAFIPHLLDAVTITPGCRLLDVGCGPGYAAEAARSLGAEPVGVDFSADMVRLARQRNPEIEFRVSDAQALDFDNGSFDIVVMNSVLGHLSDPEAAFSEAHRVLRPGGQYGFTFNTSPEESPVDMIIWESVQRHLDRQVERVERSDVEMAFRDPDHCRQKLAAVGFDPQSLVFRTVKVMWELPDASFIFTAMRDHAPGVLLAAQSPEAQQAIEAQLEASFQAYQEGDGLSIPRGIHVVAITAA